MNGPVGLSLFLNHPLIVLSSSPSNNVLRGPSFSAFTAGRTSFLAWTAARILSMRKGFHQFFFLLLFEASFLQTQALISVALLWKLVLILSADRKQEATLLWKPA
jgi:hypothetical protein